MASKQNAREAPAKTPLPSVSVWLPPVALAWLVPGGGHFLLKRHGRGGLILFAVAGMFLCGLLMRGTMFQPQTGDLLTTIINVGGFIADVCNGLLYLLTAWLGYNQPDVAGHSYDYGTKFQIGRASCRERV